MQMMKPSKCYSRTLKEEFNSNGLKIGISKVRLYVLYLSTCACTMHVQTYVLHKLYIQTYMERKFGGFGSREDVLIEIENDLVPQCDRLFHIGAL